MICDICHRQHHLQKRPFLCAVDARNSLYESRLSHARLLLETEDLEDEVNRLLAHAQHPEEPTTAPQDRKSRMMVCKTEHQQALETTEHVVAQVARLRVEIKTCRQEIDERKANLSRRKSGLAYVSDGLVERRYRLQDETERSIKSLNLKWDRSHEKLSAVRSFLCLESAKLYGLRRVKKGSSSRHDYLLGGVEVLGLQGLNDAKQELVSSSLADIAHILVLASHYLSIRLPAEITLPHKDYPRPTIFPLDSSYQPGVAQFPGTQPPLQIDPREQQERRARPRPLYLDKPLKVLAKEDPSAYSFFLEGVALLAYDIVWACTTQGVSVGDKDSIDDFCSFGRNLYNLLIGNSLHTGSAGRIYQATVVSSATGATPGSDETGSGGVGNCNGDIVQAATGRYSHGAAHDNLCSAEGTDFLRKSKLKLPLPIKIADKLKRKLNPTPEWELLEHPDNLEDTILVDDSKGRKTREKQTSFGVESFVADVATNPESEMGSSPGAKTNSSGGTGGWTRFRNR